MQIDYSERIEKLPPYIFAEIDAAKEKLIKKGKDVINLSVGDPDYPTPDFIIERMKTAVEDTKNHRYPFGSGLIQFKEAIANWYKTRFEVELDPENEVLVLIGSKEGIGHVPVAFINPGDTVLVPDPAYPVYYSGTVLAGGNPFSMPLLQENDFLPDINRIPYKTARDSRLMFLNYPNNPTASIADEEFYKQVINFAAENNIILCHDAAYSEISYDGYKPMSLLQVEGAKEVGIEFHSLSKTFNMTGWRVGFAVGNRKILKGLSKVKSNLDSGVFRAIQCAGTMALEKGPVHLDKMIKIYKKRRDLLVEGLAELGWDVKKPKATFYIWVPVPPGRTSKELAMWFLEEAQIIVTPGTGFGKYGEGYIRFSLTESTELIKDALQRMKKLSD